MKKRPNGFYRNWDNCQRAIDTLVKEHKTFPNYMQMDRSKKYPGLVSNITKYHGANCLVRYNGTERPLQELLKEASPQNERGYWSLEKSLAEYSSIATQLGHAPSATELIKLKQSALADAISKKYGGYRKMQELLRLEKRKNENGSWTLEKVTAKCRELVTKEAQLPSISTIRKKHKGLAEAIQRHGGITYFRTLLDVPEDTKPDGYWTKENTLREAQAIVAELGYLPSQHKLAEIRKSTLSIQINKHYGFAALRRKLKIKEERAEKGYWTEERILSKCKDIIKEYGDLPSSRKLKELGCKNLDAIISKRKGYRHYRTQLGLEQNVKEQGFWESEENALHEALKMMAENNWNELPAGVRLVKAGYSSLMAAIAEHHGGIKIFREKIAAYQSGASTEKQLEEFLGRYVSAKNKRLEVLLEDYIRLDNTHSGSVEK